MAVRVKRVLLTAAKALVSAGLIALALHAVDVAALAAAMRRLTPTSLAGALVLIVAQALVVGWRWHRIVVLLGARLPPRDAVRWVFVGMFFNNVLPTAVGGDAVRIWLLRKSGAPLALSFGSVAIERGTGIVILGLMVSTCVPAIWTKLGASASAFVLAGVGPTLLAGLIVVALADKLIAQWFPRSVARSMQWLGHELRRLAIRPPAFAELAALGIAASFTGLLAAYVLGESLGLQVALPAYIVLVGGSVLLSVLPISLGGWGVREVSMVTLFGAVGGSAEQALALSLLWGALPLAGIAARGLMWSRGAPTHAPRGDNVEGGDAAVATCRNPNLPR
jgi:uncharacterized membrane protein YbhN (UPF0104 family)